MKDSTRSASRVSRDDGSFAELLFDLTHVPPQVRPVLFRAGLIEGVHAFGYGHRPMDVHAREAATTQATELRLGHLEDRRLGVQVMKEHHVGFCGLEQCAHLRQQAPRDLLIDLAQQSTVDDRVTLQGRQPERFIPDAAPDADVLDASHDHRSRRSMLVQQQDVRPCLLLPADERKQPVRLRVENRGLLLFQQRRPGGLQRVQFRRTASHGHFISPCVDNGFHSPPIPTTSAASVRVLGPCGHHQARGQLGRLVDLAVYERDAREQKIPDHGDLPEVGHANKR